MRKLIPQFALGLTLVISSGHAWADEDLSARASWKPVVAADIRPQVLALLAEKIADPTIRQEKEQPWTEVADAASGEALLELLIGTIAATNPEGTKLVELCAKPVSAGPLPNFAFLEDAGMPALARNNLKLYYARWLIREGLDDEATHVLSNLTPADVVDPAGFLFYSAIAHHRIVDVDGSRKLAGQLLEREAELPRRYRDITKLLDADLSTLDPDSLDHISRRMDDIGRRLDKGKTGDKVIEIEDGVITSLDKLIKELEDQQKQQSQQAAASPGSQPSNSPMQDSRLARMRAKGDVDKKKLPPTSGWGDLPPKEREKAMQDIGKEFPSYYRDVIEQSYRKWAGDSEGIAADKTQP